MDQITAITLTGDRPLAFSLCQRWMKNQTIAPSQWIVVDDGKIPCEWLDQRPLELSGSIEYVRREPSSDDPKPTLHINFWCALPLIKGEKIIIFEDDEYYAPSYIEEMAHQLDQHEMVGIARSKYYHLMTGGYCINTNLARASLAETAFRSSFLSEFKELVKNGIAGLSELATINKTWLDILMWEKIKNPVVGRGFLFTDAEEPLYLGMKGLPGRSGLIGHSNYPYQSFDTVDRKVLRQWVSKDYQIYLDILNGRLTEKTCQSYFQ